MRDMIWPTWNKDTTTKYTGGQLVITIRLMKRPDARKWGLVRARRMSARRGGGRTARIRDGPRKVHRGPVARQAISRAAMGGEGPTLPRCLAPPAAPLAAKGIPPAVKRADVGGMGRVVLDLLPEVTDVEGQIALFPLVSRPPHLCQELLVGHDRIPVAHQAGEEPELLAAQRHDDAPLVDALVLQVDLEDLVAVDGGDATRARS